jgi:hypothetical protein
MIDNSYTTKLFYDQYLYKLVITNSLASIFRNNNLAYARGQLDRIQLDYESNSVLRLTMYSRNIAITKQEFVAAKILLSELDIRDDYKIRIENPNMSIYSNNKQWIKTLIAKPLVTKEFWEPKLGTTDLLVKNNIIITDESFGFKYKITLKDRIDSQFYNWLIANPNKVKIGTTCLQSIKNSNYVRGFYMYIKDEKILQLITLMIGTSIARIDNLVYPAINDK